MEFARLVGIQTEIELIVPAEFEARLGQRVVADLRAGMSLGQIGGVRGDLVGDDAFFHVVLVGQPEMLLGRDIAQHRGAEPAYHRGADRRSDVVIAGRDVHG